MDEITVSQRRNLKILRIAESDMLQLLLNFPTHPRYISIPKIIGLPDGIEVLGVAHDWLYKTFDFCIYHPSFPEVEPGMRIPNLNDVAWGEYELVLLKYTRPDGDDKPMVIEME